MIGGCEGCSQTLKGQQYAKQKIINEAIKNSNGKTMAIYKEGFDWYYCTAEQAIARGYMHAEFISKH